MNKEFPILGSPLTWTRKPPEKSGYCFSFYEDKPNYMSFEWLHHDDIGELVTELYT